MNPRTIRVVEGGRIALPATFLRVMGVEVGDALVAEVVKGELRVRPRRSAVAYAQKLVRELVPEGVSLSDEIIADRRVEAPHE